MKLAIISDIHHSRDLSMVRHVSQFVADATAAGADLLLDLGDRIDDADRAEDLDRLAELAVAFRRFPGTRLHLLGNHDVVNLTGDDHERALGREPGHMELDLGDVRLIVWEPSVQFHRPRGFDSAADQLPWLVATLEADPRPAIILTHIPVSGASMAGNYYFSNNPALATYPDAADIRRAVEATGKVALWHSGHVHWNSWCNVGNIHHLTLQSPSETFTTKGTPALTWAMLEIDGHHASYEVRGLDTLSLRFTFQPSGAMAWPNPRPAIS
ncbi:MAG: metallophosphoesterase [Devosia sp.]